MELLKRKGKIKHAGWSVQSFQETEQSHILAKHKELIDVIQVRYNLLERRAEEVLFPLALQHGTGVIVRIPLIFGLLTGKFDKNSSFGKNDHRKFNLSSEKLLQYLNELEKYKPLFDEHPDKTMAQISLKFCISHPACHTVIPGGKNGKQVTENSKASDIETQIELAEND